MDASNSKRIRLDTSGQTPNRVSVPALENTIQSLRNQIQDLTDENLALRENNIKFQVENFKLERRIKELENQTHSVTAYITSSTASQSEHQQISHDKDLIIEEILDYETYLEDSDVIEEPVEEKPKPIKKIKITNDTLTEVQKTELSKVKAGAKFDSQFVYKLVVMIFDKSTLVNSSITGRPSKNLAFEFKGSKILDREKLSICKSIFNERLDKEGISYDEKEQRMKKLNFYINNKIQNLRKFYKTDEG